MDNVLLIRFGDKTTATEAERKSLEEIAEALGVTETKAVHIAINNLHRKLCRSSEIDDETEISDMSEKAPIEQMYEDFRNTAGVEFRPVTEESRRRMREVFRGMGVDVDQETSGR